MGRRYPYAVAAGAAALSLLVCGAAFAQVPPQPGGPSAPVVPAQPAGPGGHFQPGGPGMGQGRGERRSMPARERWQQMSPEDRQRFRSNAERWQQMDPERRNALREQQELRRLRMKREAEAAIRDAGLQLEAERREIFERRYIEERRRIDQALRQELREKRQRELAPVVERLKKELSSQQGATSPSATGSASATPKKERSFHGGPGARAKRIR